MLKITRYAIFIFICCIYLIVHIDIIIKSDIVIYKLYKVRNSYIKKNKKNYNQNPSTIKYN